MSTLAVPVRIGRTWFWPDGTTLPVISGGSDAGDPAGGGDSGSTKADAAADQKFTQADIDRVVSERLNRERSKYADYDDLKAKAARADELEAANKTELEKAIDKAAKEADKTARADERSKGDARIVRAEVKAAAGGKMSDPNDAVQLLDLSQFKVDDDGEVDSRAIAAAIDDLIKTKPYLAVGAKGGGKMPDLGQGGRESVKVTGRDAGLAEARRRFGDGTK